jgi:hypothetical protein
VAIETGDFYEDDEPIEDVLAAWERGTKGVTAPRRRGFNMVFEIGRGVRAAAAGETVVVRSLSLRPDQPMVATS